MMIRQKYPRTPHLPLSQGYSSDGEEIFADLLVFLDNEIVITEKLDGENCSLYRDGFHARSLNEPLAHESRDWLKNYHAQFAHEIPEAWRICAENLYARHSIVYENLENYLWALSVWNEKNVALSWDATLDFLSGLSPNPALKPPPQLFRGRVATLPELFHLLTSITNSLDLEKQEGIVIRTAGEIAYEEFRNHVCKWVRKNHVSADEKHWRWGRGGRVRSGRRGRRRRGSVRAWATGRRSHAPT